MIMNDTFDPVTHVGALPATTECVNLSGRRLRTISPELIDALARFTGLTTLWLDRNYLEEIPAGLGRLVTLEVLWLEHNDLTALPDELGQLAALRELKLGHNKLTALPSVLGRLTALATLELEHNQFTEIPDVLFALEGLTRLTLEPNPLVARIPDRLASLVLVARSSKMPTFQNLLTELRKGYTLYVPILIDVEEEPSLGDDPWTGRTVTMGLSHHPVRLERHSRGHLGKRVLTLGPNKLPGTHDVPVTVGRSRHCDVRIDSDSVSNVHASVVFDRTSGDYHIVDEHSHNGTYINGEALTPGIPAAVWSGAYVGFGDAVFVFIEPATLRKLSKLAL